MSIVLHFDQQLFIKFSEIEREEKGELKHTSLCI